MQLNIMLLALDKDHDFLSRFKVLFVPISHYYWLLIIICFAKLSCCFPALCMYGMCVFRAQLCNQIFRAWLQVRNGEGEKLKKQIILSLLCYSFLHPQSPTLCSFVPDSPLWPEAIRSLRFHQVTDFWLVCLCICEFRLSSECVRVFIFVAAALYFLYFLSGF